MENKKNNIPSDNDLILIALSGCIKKTIEDVRLQSIGCMRDLVDSSEMTESEICDQLAEILENSAAKLRKYSERMSKAINDDIDGNG